MSRPLLFAEHVAWILGVTAVAAAPSLLFARRFRRSSDDFLPGSR